MIWFSCKQCSKKHNRPDSQAGAMIFCDCGQGLRVPWSSTIDEPETNEEPIPFHPDSVPSAPKPSRAVPVDDTDGPRRPSIPLPPNPPSGPPMRNRKRYRKVNPGFCLNHDESATAHTCADCRLPFCAGCVVALKGEMVCGPCKNFRLRSRTRPPRVSALAIVGLIVSVVSGPVAFCLSFISLGSRLNPDGSISLTVVFALLGTLLPAGGIVLSMLALRSIETRPNMGGRGMALTGLVTGAVAVLWNLTIAMLFILKHLQE